MLTQLVLFLAISTSTQVTGEVGQVAATSGSLTLQREGAIYLAKPGAPILVGDQIKTAGASTAKVLLDDGHLISLASDTTIQVEGTVEARCVALDKGEIRVVTTGETPFTLQLKSAQAELTRGILRASSAQQRFRVDRGTGFLKTASRGNIRLEQGREISAEGPRPILVSNSSANSWQIQPEDLTLTSVLADAGPLLAQQTVKERASTPVPSTPSVGGSKPSTPNTSLPPLPGQPRTPSTSTPPTGRPPAIPGEDEPRRTGPPPEAPTEETRRSGPPPEAPTDETRRSTAANPANPNEDIEEARSRQYRPIAVAQPAAGSSISLALGGLSTSSGLGSSAAFFSDAQQDTLNLNFPGNVHLVTSATNYTLQNVHLTGAERVAIGSQLWSIGVGQPPVSQVFTNVGTATNLRPATIAIPHTNAYLVRFDQYRINPPGSNSNGSTGQLGITGFLGQNPVSPIIAGATPLKDSRAQFNDRLTFGLGELAMSTQNDKPVLEIRRSDQDRQIIPSPTGNDTEDKVTPNPQVTFKQIHDAKFFPNVPLVYVPNQGTAQNPILNPSKPPAYSGLDYTRKAAATTLVANSLFDYSKRTGQTRFVVDGKVVDIAGYVPPKSANPPMNALMRSGHASPGMAGSPVKANHAGGKGLHRHK